MGIIKNWKARRQERINAAMSRDKHVDVAKNLTAKLTDRVMERLKAQIPDNDTRVHCSAEIFRNTAKHFRRIQQAGAATEPILIAYTDDLKATLEKYGIVDIAEQESFILDYLQMIEDVS